MKALLLMIGIFVLLMLAGCSEGLNEQGRIAPTGIHHQKLSGGHRLPDAPEPLIYICRE